MIDFKYSKRVQEFIDNHLERMGYTFGDDDLDKLLKMYLEDETTFDCDKEAEPMEEKPHDKFSCECASCVAWRIQNEFDSGPDRELFSKYLYAGLYK